MSKRIHWYQDKGCVSKRLSAYNAQGRRYKHKPLKLDIVLTWLLGRKPTNCAYCDRPLTRANVSFDHRTALANSGEHSLANLTIACRVCNKRKLAVDPVWWQIFIDFLKKHNRLAWFNVSYRVNWRARR